MEPWSDQFRDRNRNVQASIQCSHLHLHQIQGLQRDYQGKYHLRLLVRAEGIEFTIH
jgi:hypothetical protein